MKLFLNLWVPFLARKSVSIDESQTRMGSKLLQNLEENRCYQHSNAIKK